MAGNGVPEPPLIEASGRLGPRARLKGPPEATMPEEFGRVLASVPTTVSDNGKVRFGDSLLLLNHRTEVLLQADTSRIERVVDESHSQRKEFDAWFVTTGKVLHPCARNTFTLARADRHDGFGESLDVHYGQLVRIMASNFLNHSHILYLHLQEDPISQLRADPVYHALLLPRAATRTLWRIVPAPPPEIDLNSQTLRIPTPPPVAGEVVRVNQNIWLENVETGRMLMSDPHLVSTVFGVECRVFARAPDEREETEDLEIEDLRLPATWSFVNDGWVDAVEEAWANLTGRQQWKEDEGDDYAKGELKPSVPDPQELKPMEAYERKRISDMNASLAQHPKIGFCHRIFPMLRSRGVHFIRKMRKMCEEADVLKGGVLPARTFEGILNSRVVRLKSWEFENLCEVFNANLDDMDTQFINYTKFFTYLEGIMCEERLDVVRRAYRQLCNRSDGGFVNIDSLMAFWHPECSREVQAGTMDEKEVCQDFLSQWDADNADGHISPEEFLRYYRDVAMCYEDTGEFVQMVKTAWDL
mmetsp:Transcript_24228/g.45977  ORF Transcript_24228/g.45977 Transcript_24228/m.45977 type:complete len:529 (-) Transcript_24228:55-1641(-)